MYEYVAKSEYAPVRKELEAIIHCVQTEMRETFDMPFQFRLIGSGNRHLITRVKGGNRGYDFDYNLILPHPGNGYVYKAGFIKQNFMKSFRIAIEGTPYSFPKDSTSAITIKSFDQHGNGIRHRCDFAIIYFGNCNGEDGYFYLRNNKVQGSYEFAFRPLNSNIDEKVQKIRNIPNGWNTIRKEYLRLKNINEGKEKSSFSLYMEAVNNVYNQFFYENRGELICENILALRRRSRLIQI